LVGARKGALNPPVATPNGFADVGFAAKGFAGFGGGATCEDTMRVCDAGSETADLHLLVRKYKEWCFAMFPSMPFEPLVDKIGALSGNKIVQNFVSRMHENLERGLPMQDLALGVERSHDAYVPSDGSSIFATDIGCFVLF
jgi:hypothetical protein